MRVAAVNWQVRDCQDLDGFFGHVEELVAACHGAELIVMPELTSLELLSRQPDIDPDETPAYLADLLQPSFARFGDVSARYATTLVAGTHFARTDEGIVNTAVIGLPSGAVLADIPKVVLTQYESREWRIEPGRGLRTLPDRRVGVTVCYDVEFPESGRALAEAGVLVQCVPAFTEKAYGFQRVRWACRARSVENQIYVIHASLVGNLGKEPIPATVGTSAVLSPSTEPFPVSAVLAETKPDVEAVALADLDLQLLEAARVRGDVRNWEDRYRGDWTVWPAT